jgi:anti-anti-sigma factor
VLTLRGEHDVTTAPSLGAELEAVSGTNVVVDLAEVGFIDSSIIGAVFRGLRAARDGEDRDLVVCAPPGSFARRLFDQAGLSDAVLVFDSRDDAVEHFDPD